MEAVLWRWDGRTEHDGDVDDEEDEVDEISFAVEDGGRHFDCSLLFSLWCVGGVVFTLCVRDEARSVMWFVRGTACSAVPQHHLISHQLLLWMSQLWLVCDQQEMLQ
jgi:hypothetical protein